MTTMPTPKFLDSPYFVMEPGNWHLKPGAPKATVDEFERFMKALYRAALMPPAEVDRLLEAEP
jgi:hypothetical protein